MKKVLFVVSSLNRGGLETYLLRFAVLFGSKLKITILCRQNRYGPYFNDFLRNGCIVRKIKLGYGSLVNHIRFYSLLRSEKFDTIVDFGGMLSGLALYLSMIAGVEGRIVFFRNSRHQFNLTRAKKLYLWLSRILLDKSANLYLSNSVEAFRFFLGLEKIDNKKYKLIKNGIPLVPANDVAVDRIKSELQISSDAFIIGHVGNFREAKNFPTIFKVADALMKEHDDIVFVFCGSGIDVACDNFFDQNRNRVICLGSRTDVRYVIRCFDLFFFPSINEGLPNALIEAAIEKRPLVASSIKAIKDSLPFFMWDFLREPNDIDGFCKLITELKEGRRKIDCERLSDWCKNEYDYSDRTREFFEQL